MHVSSSRLGCSVPANLGTTVYIWKVGTSEHWRKHRDSRLAQGGGGGEGVLDPKLGVPKWPDQIFPIVNFVFSHDGHFGLGRGGGGFGGGVPPPLVFNYSKEALGGG